MSTNGHIPDITPGEINRILDEWSDAGKHVREQLHKNVLQDARSFQECEFDVLVTRIIPNCFKVSSGSAPDDNEKSDDKFWNYPEFARIINERAKRYKITTKSLIDRAFDVLVRHEADGRVKVLIVLFGKEFVERVIGDRDAINKISKRRRPDSSDDPEELKTIPAFTGTRA